jgi:hypothetical protein
MRYLLCLSLSGCGILPIKSATPTSEAFAMHFYPHEVEYELMKQTTGESCMSYADLDRFQYNSPDPRAVGRGILFEQAKTAAIEAIAGCDGLFAIRTKVDFKSTGAECTTVTGRCYKLTYIRATPTWDAKQPQLSSGK